MTPWINVLFYQDTSIQGFAYYNKAIHAGIIRVIEYNDSGSPVY